MNNPDRDRRIVRRYLALSLGFGLAMGLAFPVYASFFVEYKSGLGRLVFVAGCAAAGILVGAGSFLIGKATILRAVAEVRSRLGAIGAGSRAEEIGLRSSDAIGELVEAFNAFLRRMRLTVESLAAVADGTQQVGFELAANATQTSAASDQISRQMDTVLGETEVLVGEIGRVDQARKAIRSSALVVSDNINRQSDSLTLLGSSIETIVAEFKALASETEERARSIAATVGESGRSLGIIEKSTRGVRGIADSVSRIAEWTEAINDIAGRISLLGMNASIEAARAGQAGRGFAVVAGEIGKLSVQVGQRSGEIERGLKEVVARVEEAVAFAAGSQGGLAGLLGRVESGAAQIAELSERFARIASKVDGMLEAHNQLVKVTIAVTDSIVGMRDNTGEIEDSVNILLDSSRTYKGVIDEISLGIREIATDVAHLHGVSESNAENARALREEIAKFGA